MEITLKEHLEGIDSELSSLILKISDIAVMVSNKLPYMRGIAETRNVYGDLQSALDLWTDQLFIVELKELGSVNKLASEEQKGIVRLNNEGRFFVTSDPLDGSSNIASNNIVASIVGVYEKDFFTKGRNLVATMYILYGPVLSLAYSVGKGVHEFLYKPLRHFILESENIKFPDKGVLYGVGGLRRDWQPQLREFVEELEDGGLKLRYSGAFAGDFNQILRYGGIVAYPELVGKPEGKLRLLFESSPVAFMAEQAGGASSDGTCSISEIEPTSIDQRIPTYIGNKYLVERLEQALQEE